MTVIAYAAMLAFVIAVAGVWDAVWLRYLRPYLARTRGWREVDPRERIPAVAWAGAGAFLSIIFIFLPFVGVSEGY